MPAFHLVNDQLGHIPAEAVLELASLFEIPPAEVQDSYSFYGYFKQDRPQGRHRVWLCRSIACAVREAEQLLAHTIARLGIQPGETTADGQISLEITECLGACDGAPAALIDQTLHVNLTRDSLDAILDQLKKSSGEAS